jgi:hypothetical protein
MNKRIVVRGVVAAESSERESPKYADGDQVPMIGPYAGLSTDRSSHLDFHIRCVALILRFGPSPHACCTVWERSERV